MNVNMQDHGRLSVRVGAALLCLALAGCAGIRFSMGEPADDGGVRVESIRLTAADTLVDLRFRITDAERAAPFFSRKTQFELVDPETGARLGVPNTPKLGRLRQIARSDRADRSYFVLFANPGRYLKPGSRVLLVAGDTRIGPLTVE